MAKKNTPVVQNDSKVLEPIASGKAIANPKSINTVQLKKLYGLDTIEFTESYDEDDDTVNGHKFICPLNNDHYLYIYSATEPTLQTNWIRLANPNGNDHWISTNAKVTVTL